MAIDSTIFRVLVSCFVFLLVGACNRPARYDVNKIPASNAIITKADLKGFTPIVTQKVYVPIYSNIQLQDEGLQVPLQATVSIRNTDSDQNLMISRISYFNTNGERVRDYLKEPIAIKAFGSHEVFVATGDLDGGSGAKFIVEWQAQKDSINRPIIEAIFSGTRGSGAFTFSSRGVQIN